MSPFRVWDLTRDDVALVAVCGQPGDALREIGRVHAWRALRRQLTLRGLLVVRLGRRCHLVPHDALAGLSHVKQLGQAVHGGDALALLPLRDQLEELGIPPEAADLIAQSCDPAASPAGIRGGDPWRASPRRDEPPDRHCRPAPTPSAVMSNDGEEGVVPTPRLSKLSRLQRDLLRQISDYVTSPEGAPWALLHQGSGRVHTAALSRALRRLEGRGLVLRVRGPAKRTTHVRLTAAGVSLLRGQQPRP